MFTTEVLDASKSHYLRVCPMKERDSASHSFKSQFCPSVVVNFSQIHFTFLLLSFLIWQMEKIMRDLPWRVVVRSVLVNTGATNMCVAHSRFSLNVSSPCNLSNSRYRHVCSDKN